MDISSLSVQRESTAAAAQPASLRLALGGAMLTLIGLAVSAVLSAMTPTPEPPKAATPEAPTAPALAFASPLEGLRLTRQDGAPWLPEALRGKTVLVNFVFTACSTTCPGTTQQLRELQQALAAQSAQVEFVTVTVDPLSDTPANLQRYAQNQGVDFTHWQWLTGEPAQVERLIQTFGALQGSSRNPQDHLSSLFLIDGFGRVIGRLSGAPVNLDRTQREVLDIDRSISARARLAQG